MANFKNPDQLANSMSERFKYDANKYPLAKPKDRGYEYEFDNGRTIFDSDAFTDYTGGKDYMPDKYKFRVSNAGKFEHFPTFDEAYRFASETPISNPFELSDEKIPEKIRPYRQGSMSQEVGSLYENLSDKYGVDFNDLIYGENGFERKVRPTLNDDFKGDVIYSEKLWDALDNWFKQNTGMSLADRKKYVDDYRLKKYGIKYDDQGRFYTKSDDDLPF